MPKLLSSVPAWCSCVAGAAVLWVGAVVPVAAASPAVSVPKLAAKSAVQLPPSVQRVSQWALTSGDAGQQPYVVIDKPGARAWVFDARGQVQGSAPVLLGLARGDDSVPGIGERPIAKIQPHERTTPAGRFVAELGVNHNGEDIVWIDYDAAVSMHRVRPINPAERRLQRLASPTATDNRISYGCINVPVAFYEARLKPLFASGPKIVYVLPDQKRLAEVFALDAPTTATAPLPSPISSAEAHSE